MDKLKFIVVVKPSTKIRISELISIKYELIFGYIYILLTKKYSDLMVEWIEWLTFIFPFSLGTWNISGEN